MKGYYVVGILSGVALTMMATAIVDGATGAYSRRIPRIEQVQQGYIAPSKLEIECEDLDGNGELETIMKVGDKSYLLREVDGKPVISAYEIKPVEIVPK